MASIVAAIELCCFWGSEGLSGAPAISVPYRMGPVDFAKGKRSAAIASEKAPSDSSSPHMIHSLLQ
eukprot:8022372-Pyramimonas_sp.AAC.1